MSQFSNSQFLNTLKQYTRLITIIIPVSILIGSSVALFLWLLTLSIHYRFAHPYLLYFLPLAGIAIHFIYKWAGRSAEKGNNLIIDEIHNPGDGVPKRMAPLVLFTTLITHLFGGSAGREGTAVQMGGSIAQAFAKWLKLDKKETGIMLTAGIAAGFGAVFGTPLTGAIFAIEVLTLGGMQYNAFIPSLVAGIIGDVTVAAWHVHHTAYHIDVIGTTPHWFILLLKVIVASIAFGLAAYLFSKMVHGTKSFFVRWIKIQWLIPVIGALIIIGLTYIIGKPDYLSLGVDAEHLGAVTIPSAFHTGGSDTWSWLWKTIYTTVTLGTGFKGGEVTPLFYIGATLGNTLSVLMDAPVSLFAALGFIAVFSGATNTPLACTFMGVELFGSEHALLFAVACFIAYIFSGHIGIYSAQRRNKETLSYLHQKLAKYSIGVKRKSK